MRVWIALLLTLACARPPEAPGQPPGAPSQPSNDAPATAVEASSTPLGGTGAAAASVDQPIAARHILISWKGAVQANAATRSKDEARALAESLLQRLRAGEDFVALARKYSDDQVSGTRGGSLGVFGRGAMVAAFEQAAYALPIGGLSGLVESPFGYHIIRREAVDQIPLSEIIVSWQGAVNAGELTRDKEEARTRVQEAATRLAAGEPFDGVARALSDGAAAPWGGELGLFQRGELPPRLDAAAFALGPGQRTAILETAAGFHILQRDTKPAP